MREIINKPVEIIIRKGMGYDEMEKLDYSEGDLDKFDEKHTLYKEVVKEILLNNQFATNNDFVLVMEFYRAYGLLKGTKGKNNCHFYFSNDDVCKFPSPESITRARRSLIIEAIKKDDKKLFMKIIPQNPIVRERRFKNQKVMREYFRQKNL